MSERKVGSVTYKEVGEGYFEQRGLRRHAGVWSLWALGVGAVISGDYYGWNFGLSIGGFGGLLIATGDHRGHVLRTRLQHRRDVPGVAAHRRRVLLRPLGDGPVGRLPHRARGERRVRDHHGRGRRCDRAARPIDRRRPVQHHRRSVLEQRAVLVGGLLHRVPRDQHQRHRGHDAVHHRHHGRRDRASCWCSTSRRSSSGKFDPSSWFNIADGGGEAPAGGGSFLPFGVSGIFKALPFAIWFYLAIEEVPLAAEESMDPRRDVPKGTIRGMHTLLIASIGTLLLNSGVGGGARDRRVGHPAVRRLQGDLRRQHRRRAARPDRA